MSRLALPRWSLIGALAALTLAAAAFEVPSTDGSASGLRR